MKVLPAVFATLLMFSTVNAVEIPIDEFSTPQGSISDLTIDSTAVIDLVVLTGLPVTDRELSTNLLTSSVPVQYSVEVIGGMLNVTDGNGENSR